MVRNDETTADRLLAGGFTHFVLSPGPGTPHEPADIGVCAELIARVEVPCLGVCLGHQAIAAGAGGRVVPAATVMHGRRSRIRHAGTGVFAGLPQDFPAVRYHSLVVRRPLGAGLVETAWSDDGVLMGLSHRDRPLHGVQFHPESVETACGARLISNFLGSGGATRRVLDLAPAGTPATARPEVAARPEEVVRWRRLARAVPADRVFVALHAGDEHAFWLDSARRTPDLGRYSVLGSGRPVPRGTGPVFAELRGRLGAPVARPAGYPLPFAGGLVGYLGYGAKAELGIGGPAPGPDAEFLWVDRFVGYDHATGAAYAVTVGLAEVESDRWLDGTAAAIDALPDTGLPVPAPVGVSDVRSTVDRATYGTHFAEIQRWLRRGDSYEACYTYRITARSDGDPLAAYLRLRRDNPAPYGAYLRVGGRHLLCSSPERFVAVDADGLAEARPIKGTAARDADPERDRQLRDALARDEKDRGENLMIVDLLRNDLGRVCRPGTVRVPALMAVESYATVHHLVSTVRGLLRPGLDALDCVAALFPGGSMTGAPKRRTVELLDGLETTPRGVYSGCLGHLGRDRTGDLAIVIRTIVWEADRLTIGVGGAVTVLSDPDEEYAETELKAAAVLRALGVGQPVAPA